MDNQHVNTKNMYPFGDITNLTSFPSLEPLG